MKIAEELGNAEEKEVIINCPSGLVHNIQNILYGTGWGGSRQSRIHHFEDRRISILSYEQGQRCLEARRVDLILLVCAPPKGLWFRISEIMAGRVAYGEFENE